MLNHYLILLYIVKIGIITLRIREIKYENNYQELKLSNTEVNLNRNSLKQIETQDVPDILEENHTSLADASNPTNVDMKRYLRIFLIIMCQK